MKTQPISRRALAAGLALAPVAGLPALAGAAQQADPILAAIERHKESWRSFEDVCHLVDNVLAELEGREVTQDDEDAYEEANNREKAAMATLLNTVPQTKAGARATIEYLLEYDRGCEPRAVGVFAATLLRSPILEANGRA